MCGRFSLTTDLNKLQQSFNLDEVPPVFAPRYNIAPSQPVAVIANDNPKKLTFFKWGLVPSWAKDPRIGSKMINARAETLEEKPSFRTAFKRRRCLIPADGFFEWAKRNGDKVPVYIRMKDHRPFAFAGLWETWFGPEGEEIRTCTIITTTPNEVLRQFHHRMAVILSPQDYETWLSPDELPAEALKPLLQPYQGDDMEAYEVSRLVNSPANDTPECIQPYEPPEQRSLL